jgi:intraflagellar transport protein 172
VCLLWCVQNDLVDNVDFLTTDIPLPKDVPMPAKPALPEREREEVRSWILENVVSTTAHTLPTRACEKCGKETYEPSLCCHSCKQTYAPCVVTGYPIARDKRVQCKTCTHAANRDDWNTFVSKMKVCPWCGSLANPIY